MTAGVFLYQRNIASPDMSGLVDDIDTFAVYAQTAADALDFLELSFPGFNFVPFSVESEAGPPVDYAGYQFEVDLVLSGVTSTFEYTGVAGDTATTVATALTALMNASGPGAGITSSSGAVITMADTMAADTTVAASVYPPDLVRAYDAVVNPSGAEAPTQTGAAAGIPGLAPGLVQLVHGSVAATVTIVAVADAPNLVGAFRSHQAILETAVNAADVN